MTFKRKEITEEFLIWWTQEEDCIIQPYKKNITILPKYIWDEYHSRYGRNGRGRLWIHKSLEIKSSEIPTPPPESLQWEDERKLGKAGGIVFCSIDYGIVNRFPGIITKLNLGEV